MRLLLLLRLLFAASVYSQTSVVWDPKSIHWQDINQDGSKYAVLEGDRSKPGSFTYAFFLPNGVWVGPHTHTGTARVFVVSGTLLLGDGKIIDKTSARPIPKGHVFLVPQNAPHWEGAKGDALIIGVGTGSWKTTVSD